MERLTYIHIEPNNGGIVLNVSGEGLCFHSIAPVEQNGKFRFSLLEQNRRIDACGELTWTDEIKKVGGVRFTTLTAEAGKQVQNWISQPAAPLEEHEASTLGSALLKAFPGFRAHRSHAKTDSANLSVFVAALLKMKTRMKLSGFSGRLATGLLVSALWGCVFMFYAHRRDIGESLIHLGERLAAKPEPERRTASPAPQVVSSPKEVASPVRSQIPARALAPARAQIPTPSQTVVRAQTPVERPKNLLAQPLANPEKPKQVTLTPPSSAVTGSSAVSGPTLEHPTVRGTAEMTLPMPPAPSLGVLPSPAANVIPNRPSPPTTIAVANTGPIRNSSEPSAVSPSQMYFEIGKFKDELWARNLSDKMAELGLHASVMQKGHLWMNSYIVLVGPYINEEEATKTHKDLVSHGYKPRPFERGSRNFIFVSGLTLNGTRLPVGDFTISWESYVTNLKVKFAQGSYVLATADGRWIKQPGRYERDEYVYRKSNESRLLLEVHFSGLDRALVFHNSF